MPDLYGFSSDQVERIRRALENIEGSSVSGPRQPGRSPLQSAKIAIGALTSAAAATTALLGKPTVATLNVYSFSSTGVEDTGIDITVYNFAPQSATTDRWTIAERDSFTGKWAITTQFCS